jgi:hypothetical protein
VVGVVIDEVDNNRRLRISHSCGVLQHTKVTHSIFVWT